MPPVISRRLFQRFGAGGASHDDSSRSAHAREQASWSSPQPTGLQQQQAIASSVTAKSHLVITEVIEILVGAAGFVTERRRRQRQIVWRSKPALLAWSDGVQRRVDSSRWGPRTRRDDEREPDVSYGGAAEPQAITKAGRSAEGEQIRPVRIRRHHSTNHQRSPPGEAQSLWRATLEEGRRRSPFPGVVNRAGCSRRGLIRAVGCLSLCSPP